MIVAPHQDDETFGCGGLIALKRQQGIEVTVLFLTDGSRSHGSLSEPEQARLVSVRKEEALSALAVLEIPPAAVHFLDFPDGELSHLSAPIASQVESQLLERFRQFQPAEVFVPHRRDSHADHEAANRMVRRALREYTDSSVVLYEYPIWLIWSRNRLFQNLYWGDLVSAQRLSIDSVLQEKSDAITRYTTQLETLPPGFADQFLIGHEIFFRIQGHGR